MNLKEEILSAGINLFYISQAIHLNKLIPVIRLMKKTVYYEARCSCYEPGTEIRNLHHGFPMIHTVNSQQRFYGVQNQFHTYDNAEY